MSKTVSQVSKPSSVNLSMYCSSPSRNKSSRRSVINAVRRGIARIRCPTYSSVIVRAEGTVTAVGDSGAGHHGASQRVETLTGLSRDAGYSASLIESQLMIALRCAQTPTFLAFMKIADRRLRWVLVRQHFSLSSPPRLRSLAGVYGCWRTWWWCVS